MEKTQKLDVTIAGSGGSKGHNPVEHDDTLQSRAMVSIVDMISEGRIGGLVDGDKSIYLDDTPLQNPDGSYNFPRESLVTEFRHGEVNQPPLSMIEDSANSTSVNAEVKHGTPYTFTITNSDIDKVRVIMALPQGLFHQYDNGDVAGTEIAYHFEVSVDGGPFYVVGFEGTNGTIKLFGKTRSRYQRNHVFSVPKFRSTCSIRAVRETPGSDSAGLVNSLWIDGYAEIIESSFIFPHTALAGIRVDSAHFNSVPERSYYVHGLEIRVPSNYDPVARTYSGVWDGTFKFATTSNPAWVMYDLLLHKRYGLGRYLSENQVDKASFYKAGRYCDERVPDGRGGQEPRFSINTEIAKPVEAYKLLTDIASVFRSSLFWAGSMAQITQDAPTAVSKIFTAANVGPKGFTYTGSARKDRHSVAIVTWNDPEQGFKQVPEYVEDTDLVEKIGIRETEVVAFGCTSRAQAHRVGRWLLYSEASESNVINFDVALEGAMLLPGEVVQIQDKTRAGRRLGGRMVTIDAARTRVTLDAPVKLQQSGATFSIMLPDGTVAEAPVTNGVGEHKQIRLARALPSAPVANAVWTIKEPNLVPLQARVLGVKQNDDDESLYTVTAVEHNPLKYASIDLGVELEVPPTNVQDKRPDAPKNLTFTTARYAIAGETMGLKGTLSWDGMAPSHIVRYRRRGDAWAQEVATSNSLNITNIELATYEFEVQGRSALGKLSPIAYLTYEVEGVGVKPGVVTGLVLETPYDGNELKVKWNKTPGAYGYEVQLYSPYYDRIVRTTRVGDALRYEYSADDMRHDGGPFRTLIVRVRALGLDDAPGDWAEITASNGQIPMLTGIKVEPGVKSIFATFDRPADPDYAGFICWVSTEPGFTPSDATIVYDGIGTMAAVLSLADGTPIEGKTTYYVRLAGYDTYDKLELNISSEIAVNPVSLALGPEEITAEMLEKGLLDVTKFAESIEPVGIVDELPDPATHTRPAVVLLKTDGKMYRLVDGKWTASIPTVDLVGTVKPEQIEDKSLDASKFATGVEPLHVVDALPPVAGYTGPRVVMLKADGKLYRYDNGKWNAKIVADDVAGQLKSDQIAAIEAGKVTGQLTNEQIKDLDAAKLAGQIKPDAIPNNAITADKFATGLEPISTVKTLPAVAGYTGPKVVMLEGDGKLYRLTNGAWQSNVDASDIAGQLREDQLAAIAASKVTGQLTAAQLKEIEAAKVTGQLAEGQIANDAVTAAKIKNGVIDAAKFVAGTEPIRIVAALPAVSGYTGPKVVMLETNGKLYRLTGGAWKASVESSDITGTLGAAQIAAVEASKVTGQLTADQIAAVEAAKVTGQIKGTQLAESAVTVDKIANGAIEAAKFATGLSPVQMVTALPAVSGYTGPKVVLFQNKLYRYTGTSWVASVPTTDLTGTITGTQLGNNVVTTDKLANAAVDSAKIADGAVTADKLQANSITARELVLTDFNDVILDPQFERGLGGFDNHNVSLWKSTDADTPTGAPALTGVKLLRNTVRFVYVPRISVQPGQVWLARADVIAQGAGLDFKLSAQLLRADGSVLGYSQVTFDAVSTKRWETLEASLKVPADVTYARFRILTESGTVGDGAYYVTNWSVKMAYGASLIVDGAITADKVAANSITASKLVLSDVTNMVRNDFSGGSLDGWFTKLGNSASFNGEVVNMPENLTAPQGPWVYRSNVRDQAFSEYISVSPGEVYYLSAWVYNTEPVVANLMGVQRAEERGAAIFPQAAKTSALNEWVRLEGYIRISEGRNKLQMLLQTDRPSNSGGVTLWAKPVMRRAASAELIVDGAVTANKVAASSIVAEKLVAGSVIADKIATDAVTAGKIAAGAVTADKIAANAISAKHVAIGDFSNFAAGSDFEDDATIPWDMAGAGSTFSIVSDEAHTGSRSLRISGSERNRHTRLSTRVLVQPGDVIYAELYAKRDADYDGATSWSKLRFGSGDIFVNDVQYSRSVLPTTEWTKMSKQFVIPDGVTFLDVQLNSDSRKGNVWIDDVVIRRALGGELIVDGAISADKIAAKSISASKLVLSDPSNLILNDWTTGSLDGWDIPSPGRMNPAPSNVGLPQGMWELVSNLSDQAVSPPISCTPGDKLHFSVWAYNRHASPARLMARTQAADGTVDSWTVIATTDKKLSWTLLEGAFTVPAGKSIVHMWLNVGKVAGTGGENTYWAKPAVRRMASAELIVDGAITAVKVAAGAVETAKLAASAVVAEKIATDAITAAKIKAGAVEAAKIATGAVETDKLAANAVTANKIAANAVTADKIEANAVTAAKIQAGAITADKIAADSISARELVLTDFNDLVLDPKFERGIAQFATPSGSTWVAEWKATDGDVPANPPANTGIRFARNNPSQWPMNLPRVAVVPGQVWRISADVIATGTGRNMILGAALFDKSGTVVQWFNPNTTSASTWQNVTHHLTIPEGVAYMMCRLTAEGGTVGSGYWYVTNWSVKMAYGASLIVDGAISADKIAANAVVADKIDALAVTAGKIAAGAITTDKLDANAVTAAKVAAGAIETAKLAAGAVTAEKVAAKSISARELVLTDFNDVVLDPRFERGFEAFDSVNAGVSLWKSTDADVPAGAPALTGVKLLRNAVRFVYTNRVPVQPGQVWTMRADVIAQGAGLDFKLSAQVMRADGSIFAYPQEVFNKVSQSEWTTLETKAVMPAGAALVRFRIISESGAAGDGAYYVTNWSVKQAYGASLIVDGAITADKVAANAITAGKVAANAISADNIQADAITAKHIVVTDSSNLVLNDFTTGNLDGWVFPDGRPGLKSVTSNVTMSQGMWEFYSNGRDQAQSRVVSVKPGEQYHFSAYCYNTTEYEASIMAVTRDSAGGSTSYHKVVRHAPKSGWHLLQGMFTVPAGKSRMHFMLQSERSAGTGGADIFWTKPVLRRAASAELIVDGAITADKIAANVISAKHLVISDSSNLVINDFTTGNLDGWSIAGGGALKNQTPNVSSPQGPWEFYSNNRDQAVSGAISCAPGDTFYASVWHYNPNSGFTSNLMIRHSDAAGSSIGHSTLASVASAPTYGWVKIEGKFTVPAGKSRIHLLLQSDRPASSNGSGVVVNWAKPALRKMASAELIVDGAITAVKISAGAVETDKLAANAVVADKISANAITATKIAAGAVETAKIAAGAITAEKIAANSISARELVLTDFNDLILDPKFERGLDQISDTAGGWALALWKVSDSDVPVGAPANTGVRFTRGEISSLMTSRVTVVPGQTWHMEVDIAGTGTGGARGMRLHAQFLKADGSHHTWSTNEPQWSTTPWKRMTQTIVVPAGSAYMKPRLVNEGGVSGDGHWYLTNWSVKRAYGASLIVDGAITTDKLEANAVTAAKIAAGAITAEKIAADAITAKHIVIGDFTNLASGSDFESDATNPWDVAGKPRFVVDPTKAHTGSRSLKIGPNSLGGSATLTLGTKIDVNPGEVYYAEFWAARDATFNGGSTGNAKLRFGNQAGGLVNELSFSADTITTTEWTKRAKTFEVPASVTALNVTLVTDSTAGVAWLDNIVIRRMTGNELIVDGSISANKITSRAITTDKLDAGAVVADKIATNAIESDKIAANAITADKIAANAITADKLDAGAVTAGKIAAGAISADQIAVNAITAKHLNISDFTNLIPDDQIQDEGSWALNSQVSLAAVSGLGFNSKGRFEYVHTSGSGYLQIIQSQPFPVATGDEFFASIQTARSNGTKYNFWYRIHWIKADGSVASTDYSTVRSGVTTAAGVQKYDAHIKNVPADAVQGYIKVCVEQSQTDGNFYIGGMEVRKKSAGHLIVDGTITADHIKAASISGDRLVANTIMADRINTNSLNTAVANIFDARITNATIEWSQIQNANITTAQIKNAYVDWARIQNVSISTAQIKNAYVDWARIQNVDITTAQIKNANISWAKITGVSIGSAHIANLSVERIKIANGAITSHNYTSIPASNKTGGQEYGAAWSIYGDNNAVLRIEVEYHATATITAELWSITGSRVATYTLPSTNIPATGTPPKEPWAMTFTNMSKTDYYIRFVRAGTSGSSANAAFNVTTTVYYK